MLCTYFPIIKINLRSANVNRQMNSMPEIARSIYNTQNVICCIHIMANRTMSTRSEYFTTVLLRIAVFWEEMHHLASAC